MVLELKSSLPESTQLEIDRIQAKPVGSRFASETNFLIALDPYLHNAVNQYDDTGLITEAEGIKLPTGYTGFKKGAVFIKKDESGNGFYINIGDETFASFELDTTTSSGSGTVPTGTASGDLYGSYPNPSVNFNNDTVHLLKTGDTMAGTLNMNGNVLTNLTTPIGNQDAASKSYVDSVAQGLTVKASCVVATSSNITLAGLQIIDGVSVGSGDRVLVKNQLSAPQNGIYIASSGSWSRAADADTNGEVISGLFTLVTTGTINALTGWVLTTSNPITLNVTPLTFTQFSQVVSFLGGNGLTLTGNVFDVVGTANRIDVTADAVDIAATYVGQSSITTLGTITTGTWTGSAIGVAYGGTGSATPSQAVSNLGAQHQLFLTVGKDNADYITTDYISDDVCIQAALTAAYSAGGGEVYIKEGIYLLIANLTVYSNTLISGKGSNTILKMAGSQSVFNIFKNSDTVGGNSNIIIRDLVIDGNKANQTGKSVGAGDMAIRMYNLTNCKFLNLEIKNMTSHGLSVKGNYITANKCYVHDLDGIGLSFYWGSGDTYHNVICTENIVDTIGSTPYLNGHGIHFKYLGSEITVANNTVRNIIHNGVGIFIGSQVTKATVTGNTISYCDTNYGINVFETTGVTVTGNYIELCESGIRTGSGGVVPSTNLTITGNVVRDSTTRAIYIGQSSNTIVSGNYIENTTKGTCEGIWLSSSSLVQVIGNIVNNTVRGVFTDGGASTNSVNIENNIFEGSTQGIRLSDSGQTNIQVLGNQYISCTSTIGGSSTPTYKSHNGDGLHDGFTVLDNIIFTDGKAIQTTTGAGKTLLIQGYNSNTAAYVTLATITTGNPPQWAFNQDINFSTNARVAGYFRVGSTAAPSNQTAGDLTATRMSLGNGSALSTEQTLLVSGTSTATSGSQVFTNLVNTINPGSNSTNVNRAFYSQNLYTAATGITASTLRAGDFENRIKGDGLIATLVGVVSSAMILDSGSPATVQATSATSFVAQGFVRSSGTTTATITTLIGFDAQVATTAGLTATTVIGYKVTNPAANTITTLIGMDIPNLTRGATNIGLRIAAPTTGATANYALQLSDTGGAANGGVTFGTDTTLYRSIASTLKTDGNMIIGGTLNMNAQLINNIADPVSAQDAATKNYVDAVATGMDVKASVRAATTDNITLSGTQTIDGVAVIAGDRVLVMNQTTGSDNGIYVCAAGSWTRATDADSSVEVTSGLFTFVTEGTANGNNGFTLTTDDPITLGTTVLTFTQFSGAGQITAGAGLTKTGNTIDVGTASSSRVVVNADNIDLATTGVSASTYNSVTVDVYGRVTGGTNPTTLAGYGITDAQPLDSDLTTIAALTATTDNFIVSVSSAWASRTPAQVKTTLSLNNVENTALSTWAGSTAITTLGTIATGVWSGTAIDHTKLTGIVQSDVGGLTTSSTPTFAGLNLGTGSLSTVGNIAIEANAVRDITVGRATTGAGNTLTVQAGGAQSGSTDTNGGDLLLEAGISTGNGSNNIRFFTVASAQGAGTTDRNPVEKMRLSGATNGRLGIGTGNPTVDGITLGKQAARSIIVERQTVANTAGVNLTLQSGGATSAATDKNAGDMIVATGLSTGTGRALVRLQAATTALSTGTSDNALLDRHVIGAFKTLTNNSAINLVNCTLASNTVVGGIIRYAVEVFDGTNLQMETGEIMFQAANKGGAFSGNTMTQIGSAKQFLGSGTLAMTWAITGANPAVISLNANSSLTPSTGYPRITYSIENFTQQAIAIQ